MKEDEDADPIMTSYMPTYVRSLSDQKTVDAPPIPHMNSSTGEISELRSLPSVEKMLAEIQDVKTGKPLRSSSGVTWTSIDVMGRSMYFERVGGLKTGNISSLEALEDSKKMSELLDLNNAGGHISKSQLKGRSRCDLCTRFFPKNSLSPLVSIKKLIALRAKWGLRLTGKRYNTASYIYGQASLCVFCSQTFPPTICTGDGVEEEPHFYDPAADNIRQLIYESIMNEQDVKEDFTSKLENAAFHQNCRQSSTDTDAMGDGLAQHAVNGSCIEPCSSTLYESEPWWEVDLGEVTSIKAIKVWSKEDTQDEAYSFRMVPCWVMLSKKGFGRGGLNHSLHDALTKTQLTKAQKVTLWKLPKPVEARYVRIQLSETNFLQLRQVEVFRDGRRFMAPSPMHTHRDGFGDAGSVTSVEGRSTTFCDETVGDEETMMSEAGRRTGSSESGRLTSRSSGRRSQNGRRSRSRSSRVRGTSSGSLRSQLPPVVALQAHRERRSTRSPRRTPRRSTLVSGGGAKEIELIDELEEEKVEQMERTFDEGELTHLRATFIALATLSGRAGRSSTAGMGLAGGRIAEEPDDDDDEEEEELLRGPVTLADVVTKCHYRSVHHRELYSLIRCKSVYLRSLCSSGLLPKLVRLLRLELPSLDENGLIRLLDRGAEQRAQGNGGGGGVMSAQAAAAPPERELTWGHFLIFLRLCISPCRSCGVKSGGCTTFLPPSGGEGVGVVEGGRCICGHGVEQHASNVHQLQEFVFEQGFATRVRKNQQHQNQQLLSRGKAGRRSTVSIGPAKQLPPPSKLNPAMLQAAPPPSISSSRSIDENSAELAGELTAGAALASRAAIMKEVHGMVARRGLLKPLLRSQTHTEKSVEMLTADVFRYHRNRSLLSHHLDKLGSDDSATDGGNEQEEDEDEDEPSSTVHRPYSENDANGRRGSLARSSSSSSMGRRRRKVKSSGYGYGKIRKPVSKHSRSYQPGMAHTDSSVSLRSGSSRLRHTDSRSSQNSSKPSTATSSVLLRRSSGLMGMEGAAGGVTASGGRGSIVEAAEANEGDRRLDDGFDFEHVLDPEDDADNFNLGLGVGVGSLEEGDDALVSGMGSMGVGAQSHASSHSQMLHRASIASGGDMFGGSSSFWPPRLPSFSSRLPPDIRVPCGLCSYEFPKRGLTQSVTVKAVYELLRHWDVPAPLLQVRLKSVTAQYDRIHVCAMCHQHFNKDFDAELEGMMGVGGGNAAAQSTHKHRVRTKQAAPRAAHHLSYQGAVPKEAEKWLSDPFFDSNHPRRYSVRHRRRRRSSGGTSGSGEDKEDSTAERFELLPGGGRTRRKSLVTRLNHYNRALQQQDCSGGKWLCLFGTTNRPCETCCAVKIQTLFRKRDANLRMRLLRERTTWEQLLARKSETSQHQDHSAAASKRRKRQDHKKEVAERRKQAAARKNERILGVSAQEALLIGQGKSCRTKLSDGESEDELREGGPGEGRDNGEDKAAERTTRRAAPASSSPGGRKEEEQSPTSVHRRKR